MYPISQIGSIIFSREFGVRLYGFDCVIANSEGERMAGKLEATILINKPTEDIFKFLNDWHYLSIKQIPCSPFFHLEISPVLSNPKKKHRKKKKNKRKRKKDSWALPSNSAH